MKFSPSNNYDRECLLAVTARVPMELVKQAEKEHCIDCMVGQGRDCKCREAVGERRRARVERDLRESIPSWRAEVITVVVVLAATLAACYLIGG